MARRINIGQIGSFCEGQMNQLMRVVVLETDAELKAQSPVDTGRFRASWVIGENATGNYDAGRTAPGERRQDNHRNPPLRRHQLRPGTERVGNTYHIHNSLAIR
jgi:hypothetical protein